MTTIDFDTKVKEAQDELKEIQKDFKKKDKLKKKRITTHVRIRFDWRGRLLNEAKHDKMSVSKLMDKVLTFYFKHHRVFEEEVV